ncbi:VTT domain-containing protein [Streptomyces sp. TG1A-8]|uniref:VTT domain-containing protein n=1 Tax=Streptomyces sp. TG1A-8 TaxID=3051385 RepID=UPI00265C3285|nr:VTT domain-containing protein [Streptomyces sp. TG1A-8]MDO0926461.1 VTT domain-containing protein [Streptomyces sp. TG1A-8]
MMTLALGPSWLDPNHLLDTYGIWGLLLVVFAESGLLIGFFLPGDSLLFTCGLLITSHQLDFPLWGAIALICLAAVLGDQAGYMFGKKVGPSLFNRPDSRLFKQENVTKAHEFFEKYGPKSLVLARFVPIVRTFTPIVAGVSGMRYRSFLTFNVIGGVLWGAGVTLLGSWLGNIGVVKNNIEAILILIVLVSVVPIAIEFLRARGKSGKAAPQEPGPTHQAPYGQPRHQQQTPYQHPPVMDDATTRLRRIEPQEPQYWNQGHDGQGHDGQGHDGRHHDQRQYPQQQYGQDPYGQHGHYGHDQYPGHGRDPRGGQDQYGQEQYGGQDPYGQEQQDRYDRSQYPYDHRNH